MKEFATQLKLEKQKLFDLKSVFQKTFSKLDANLAAFEYEGTTASVAFVWSQDGERYLQAANVGDSSAYLW